MSSLKIIESKDGSHTIYNPELDEHYHSTHGAFQEAMHVFIKSGFEEKLQSQSEVKIFEMGFGTGLNAVLTAMQQDEQELEIEYTALEAYPLAKEILQELNYKGHWGSRGQSLFNMVHSIPWDQKSRLYPGFKFEKVESSFEDFESETLFDLVYWDAFGPRVQPELWVETIFSKMFSLMNKDGILVTYSCKGDVRRAMIAAGFDVEKIPGPPGKREILRARKN